MSKSDHVLMHFRPEEHTFVRRMIEMAERAESFGAMQLTDFLDPRQAKITESTSRTIQDIRVHTYGGYEGAERRRAIIAPSYMELEEEDWSLTGLRVQIPTQYGKVSHGDFLGAMLGLGIKREVLGDISVQEDGCDAIVSKEISEFVRVHLTSVGRLPVSDISIISTNDFRISQSQLEERRFTVMSLRLDAVAAEGFRLSRSKMTPLIDSGKVRLNWTVTENPATPVEEGDMISVKGMGRIRVLEIEGVSKKGRTMIKVGRYL